MGDLYDLLRSAYTTHTINLLRLSAATQAAIIEILSKMIDELIGKLARSDLTEYQTSRFQTLRKDAETIVGSYYLLASQKLSEVVSGLAQLEAKFARQAIADAAKVDIFRAMPTMRVLESLTKNADILGAPAREWWRRQSADTTFRYVQAVRQGIAQSETNGQIIGRVWNKHDGGILQVAKNNAEALVRTSVQSVANIARNATFQSNGDVVQGIIWVSTLDARTSAICIARSGLKWRLDGTPVDHNIPYMLPPAHFNCRSATIPWLKSWRDLGIPIDEFPASTRSSMDGQVSADLSFADWLDKKPQSFQDELLGKGRAQLWRDGTITLNQLLDQSGNPLSLAELKAKYGH